MSANQITVIGWVVGIAGCFSFLWGSYWTGIVGCILIVICKLLDYVDGGMARITGTDSKFGHLLDSTVDFTLSGLLPLSIGFGLFLETGIWVYLLLGGIYAFSKILGYLVSYGHDLAFQNNLKEVADENRLASWGVRLSLLDVPILLICAITNTLHIFLILFTLLFVSKAIGTIIVALIKGGVGK